MEQAREEIPSRYRTMGTYSSEYSLKSQLKSNAFFFFLMYFLFLFYAMANEAGSLLENKLREQPKKEMRK